MRPSLVRGFRASRVLLSLAAGSMAATLVLATDAHAAVLWDGDASRSTRVFEAVLCPSPGGATVENWGDAHGDFFAFLKPAGSERCEGHSIDRPELLRNDTTLWFGWDSMTKTGNAQTVFQWKSNGTNDQNQQNYPVIMKVEDSRLKVWHVAPGEQWVSLGSAPWLPESWHSVHLGITTSSTDSGAVEVWLDGTRIAHRTGIRTWDDMGNKPRWGTYGSTIADVSSTHWVDDPIMGDTRADVD
ncbi:heparin lyase I family protein [Streptomyces sp. NPDC053780]|uniref:heparin lyase I family protein n=1 Tax=unclassified Streptomyces TaxID=2593676 RepID=UPI003421B87E